MKNKRKDEDEYGFLYSQYLNQRRYILGVKKSYHINCDTVDLREEIVNGIDNILNKIKEVDGISKTNHFINISDNFYYNHCSERILKVEIYVLFNEDNVKLVNQMNMIKPFTEKIDKLISDFK